MHTHQQAFRYIPSSYIAICQRMFSLRAVMFGKLYVLLRLTKVSQTGSTNTYKEFHNFIIFIALKISIQRSGATLQHNIRLYRAQTNNKISYYVCGACNERHTHIWTSNKKNMSNVFLWSDALYCCLLLTRFQVFAINDVVCL